MSAAKGEWFVGVDWATEAHQLCVEDQDGQVILERIVPHTSTDLAALCDKLAELADGDPSGVHVAIEVSHGIVVETLLEREFRVFAINPKQLDRFRDRFSMSGAKDDRRDAHVLADSIRTDPQAFRPLEVDDPWIIELREWSRMWDELQRERNQLTNRFGEQLRRYFPQFLQLGDDLSAAWIVALWERVPSPQHARNIRPGQVRSILKAHRVRRIDARQVLEILRQPPMFRRTSACSASAWLSSTTSARPVESTSSRSPRPWPRVTRIRPDKNASSATLRSSCPYQGSVRSFSPGCSPRHHGLSLKETTMPCARCPEWLRSRSAVGSESA